MKKIFKLKGNKLLVLLSCAVIGVGALVGCGKQQAAVTTPQAAPKADGYVVNVGKVRVVSHELKGYAFKSRSPFGVKGMNRYGKYLLYGSDKERGIVALKIDNGVLKPAKELFKQGMLRPTKEERRFYNPKSYKDGSIFFTSSSKKVLNYKDGKIMQALEVQSFVEPTNRDNGIYCFWPCAYFFKGEIEDGKIEHLTDTFLNARPHYRKGPFVEFIDVNCESDGSIYVLGKTLGGTNGRQFYQIGHFTADGKQLAMLGSKDKKADDYILMGGTMALLDKYVCAQSGGSQRQGVMIWDKKGSYLGLAKGRELFAKGLVLHSIEEWQNNSLIATVYKRDGNTKEYIYSFYKLDFE